MSLNNEFSRRRLFQSSAVLAATGATSKSLFARDRRPKVTRLALQTLSRSLEGRLILPGEAGYTLAAFPNNARWADEHPLAVAMCKSPEDVQKCLRWVQEEGQTFAIRSGGHNYAGFSSTSGLLIHTRPLSQIRYDLDRGLAFVGAGANNQDLANALRHTPFTIPTGRCPTVGISGLVLGGGWGFSATHSGLTCDSLLSSEIVLANQNIVTAKADGPHEDLLWALRGGGGGNFGVNTSFTFQLHENRDEVTVFDILWPAEKQVELMLRLQEIQLDQATLLSTRSKIMPAKIQAGYKRDELMVTVIGQYFGPKAKALEALGPALSLVKPLQADIRQLPYWQARDFLLTNEPNGLYEVRSAYVADRLREEALETMLEWMMKWPGGSALPDSMGLLFAIGGKVKDLAPEATAYVHRKANFIFLIENLWTPMDKPGTMQAHRAWTQSYFTAMKPFLLPQNYVNFPNRDTPDFAKVYYGNNLKRLSQIKSIYDPKNIFQFHHSVPLPKSV